MKLTSLQRVAARDRHKGKLKLLFVLLGVAVISQTVYTLMVSEKSSTHQARQEALKIAFAGGQKSGEKLRPKQGLEADDKLSQPAADDNAHKVAGLSCEKYGGPSDEAAAEMVYWRDIPSDAGFVSPFKNAGPEVKYLTFEPDEGGWNNIRMGMETAVAMALAMGRTLVMPPEQKMYLLTKKKGGQKHHFTFKDFFHFDSLEVEHEALDVISFEDFLKREAMKGKLHDRRSGAVSFPPNNETNWDGKLVNYEAGKVGVMKWLRSVSINVDWDWGKCIAGFPSEPGAEAATRLRDIHMQTMKVERDVRPEVRHNRYIDNPTPVNASAVDRIREQMANRFDLCLFDESLQNEKLVHLMGDNDSNARMLVHFYVFLFFEDWRHDLWMKRFVRDHLRYVDEIQCTAARVVDRLHAISRANGDLSGTFYTMHIRRGDFQYKDTRVEAPVIYQNIRHVLPENATVYIATDEKEKQFFDLFRQHYNVNFLDDFHSQTSTLNTNFYGMLDQLIASRGKIFVGTYFSTFTGYINRLRGYHSQKDKLPGYETGALESYYYIPRNKMEDVRQFRSPYQPFWGREFPVGWRDLERGVDDMLQ